MKKTIVAMIASSIFLAGCLGIGGENSGDETNQDQGSITQNFSLYQASDFSITHPSDWEILEKKDFPSNVPTSTIVIFRSNIKNDIFTPNLNISQTTISNNLTSTDFGLQTLTTEKYNLVGFREISREEYSIGSEENQVKAFITTFQGQKTITENTIEFKQLCIARNQYGIIITGAYLPAEGEELSDKMDKIIKSFKFN